MALAVALCLLPSAAAASSTEDVFFEAPRDLTAASVTPAARTAALDQIKSLGVHALRVNLRWHDVAPGADDATKPSFDATDPNAYAWGNYAATIDAAKALGWKVLISAAAPVPKWATAAKADTVTRPIASEYQLFTTALARRFGGPNVVWSIWNEPNLPDFLKPQISGGKVVSGALYRALFIAGRQGIRDAGQTTAPVYFGETSPVGTSTDGRSAPLAFLRNALCVSTKYTFDKSCGKLTLDGVTHHPYQFVRTNKPKTDDVTYPVLSRLTSFLDKAAKAGAVNAGLPLYLTEFGVQSYPDKTYGISPQSQVERRARVERIAYYNRRVRGFSQYLLTDDNSTVVKGKTSYSGFETGLIYAKGGNKPAFNAFRLVLDAKPSGTKKVSLWGLVRPATGKTTVVIERRIGSKGSFKTFLKKTTLANGSFTASDTLHTGAQYRYRWTGPTGKITSPYVRIFKD